MSKEQVVDACINARITNELLGQEGGVHKCVRPECGIFFRETEEGSLPSDNILNVVGRVYCVNALQNLIIARKNLKKMWDLPLSEVRGGDIFKEPFVLNRLLQGVIVSTLTTEVENLGVLGIEP